MHKRQLGADSDDKKSRRIPQSKNKSDGNHSGLKTDLYVGNDPQNSLLEYKMEVSRPLLDYMCYLEQLIQDTKTQAQKEKNAVSNIILNMSHYFGIDDVTQESIDQFLNNAVVQGKELETDKALEKLDWFEMLKNKRFEAFVSDKSKDTDKKEPSIVPSRESFATQEPTVHKRKYNKRHHDPESEPRKKRHKNEVKEPKNDYAAIDMDYAPPQGLRLPDSNDLKTMLANIFQQNGNKVDESMISGFEKYISPDLKMTAPPDKHNI